MGINIYVAYHYMCVLWVCVCVCVGWEGIFLFFIPNIGGWVWDGMVGLCCSFSILDMILGSFLSSPRKPCLSLAVKSVPTEYKEASGTKVDDCVILYHEDRFCIAVFCFTLPQA